MPDRTWYYAQNNQQLGPVSEAELCAMFSQQRLPIGSLVWSEHLDEWTPASRVEPFARLSISVAPAKTEAPPAQKTPAAAPGAGQPPRFVQPWLRYLARFTDHVIYSFIAFFIMFAVSWGAYFIFNLNVHLDSSGRTMTPANAAAFYMGLVTYLVLEPLLMVTLATTPGKMLIGVRISKAGQSKRPPDVGRLVLRTLAVWLKGGPLACGFGLIVYPFFPELSLALLILGGLICTGEQIFQFIQLSKNGKTSWDRDLDYEFNQVALKHRAIAGGILALGFVLISLAMVGMYFAAENKSRLRSTEMLDLYRRDGR